MTREQMELLLNYFDAKSKSYVSFIKSARISDKAVTLSWAVHSTQSRYELGTVKWQNGWRRYCFFPNADTLYDGACLQEIAGFCNKQTNLRKMERQVERMQAAL